MQPVIKLHCAHWHNKVEAASVLELVVPMQTSCAQTGIMLFKALWAPVCNRWNFFKNAIESWSFVKVTKTLAF